MDQDTKKEFEILTQIVQKSFNHVEEEMSSVKEEMSSMKEEVSSIKEEMSLMKINLENVEKTMATKEDLGKLNIELRDFIDDKIVDLKGDLIVLMRKEDAKLVNLVEILNRKSVLSDNETKSILSAEPFPQIFKPRSA